MLQGGHGKDVTSPTGPPVKVQENTALLSDCGLTGMSPHVYLSELGGKECSVCANNVYDDEAGLSSPPLAEVQFVDCVICALFRLGRKIQKSRRQLLLHQSP